MIGYLDGKPLISAKSLIVIVNGVGYQVEVGQRTLSQVVPESVQLFIHTHVREDRFELYGFLTIEQKTMFELLLTVSGVGPKTALEIADHNPDQIIDAVQNSQISFFTQIPRIGKKLSQKIILELKPKLGSLQELSLGPRSKQEQDIFEALIVLGYEEAEIATALSQIDIISLSLEDAIKTLLHQLTQTNSAQS
ncbi:MAG TPA: Holliday junction branch migration protein RuvA [Candidatus Woesebacteria bacterium]|nr:Holliday junction branch migration protein RuvA [Candidatus Woesebacteria bacterium]